MMKIFQILWHCSLLPEGRRRAPRDRQSRGGQAHPSLYWGGDGSQQRHPAHKTILVRLALMSSEDESQQGHPSQEQDNL